jgi:hypothetical protein
MSKKEKENTTIQIKRETHKKLNTLVFEEQVKSKRKITLDEMINTLIDRYKPESYWVENSKFDPANLEADERANPWDHWVGNQTSRDFLDGYNEYNLDTIREAVEMYVNECPKMFPEASGQVSREWLIKQLVEYIEQDKPKEIWP